MVGVTVNRELHLCERMSGGSGVCGRERLIRCQQIHFALLCLCLLGSVGDSDEVGGARFTELNWLAVQ